MLKMAIKSQSIFTEYSIELLVDEQEIEKRKAEMTIKEKKDVTGYLKRYSKLVSGADQGATLS